MTNERFLEAMSLRDQICALKRDKDALTQYPNYKTILLMESKNEYWDAIQRDTIDKALEMIDSLIPKLEAQFKAL